MGLSPQALYSSPDLFEDALSEPYQNNNKYDCFILHGISRLTYISIYLYSRSSICPFKDILHNNKEPNVELPQPQGTVPAPRVAYSSLGAFEDAVSETYQNNPKYDCFILPDISRLIYNSIFLYPRRSICPFKDILHNIKEPNVALPQPQNTVPAPRDLYSSPGTFEDASPETYQNNLKYDCFILPDISRLIYNSIFLYPRSSICPFKDILHNNKEPNIALPQPQDTVLAPQVLSSSPGTFEDASPETYQNNLKYDCFILPDISRLIYNSIFLYPRSSICPFKDILHNNKEPNVALPQPQDTVLAPQVLSSSPGTFEDALPETYQNNLKSSICPFKDVLHNNKEPNIALPQPQDTVLAPQVLYSSPGTFEDALPETYQNNLKSSICPFKDFVNNNKDILHNNKEPNVVLPQADDSVLPPQVLCGSPHVFEDTLPDKYQNNSKYDCFL
ncbi:uncharacterized protein LOC143190917 isoform X2 [Rhynchophorus ferrugineus]|uniref:uncharacterized protein LOC143190917 isoform X2 n=1 Tax=Rhynchophorus ferrugineus TaxID=354439 RepID=UPI003FCEDAE7